MARFKYLNVNPNGIKEEDCVTRAISLATGLSYSEIRKKLLLVARLYKCERLCLCCYRHLLDDIFKFKRIDCDGYNVEEFADKHPYGIYLIRMNGHISCIRNSTIYDIWDCRREPITDAWKVD